MSLVTIFRWIGLGVSPFKASASHHPNGTLRLQKIRRSKRSKREKTCNNYFFSIVLGGDGRSIFSSFHRKKKQPTDRLKLPKLKAQTKMRILSLVVQICTELVVWPFSSLQRSPLKAPENKLKRKLKDRTMNPPNPVGIFTGQLAVSGSETSSDSTTEKPFPPFQIPQINDFAPPGPWKDTPNFPKTPTKKEIPKHKLLVKRPGAHLPGVSGWDLGTKHMISIPKKPWAQLGNVAFLAARWLEPSSYSNKKRLFFQDHLLQMPI